MADNFRSRARRAVVVILVCYWLAIFIGTHLPPASRPVTRMNDKAQHFGAYCGLTLLLSWACLRHRSWKGAVGVLAIIATYGVMDEWSQMLVPARTAEVADWVADICGGIVGISMYWITSPPSKSVFSEDSPSTDIRRDAA